MVAVSRENVPIDDDGVVVVSRENATLPRRLVPTPEPEAEAAPEPEARRGRSTSGPRRTRASRRSRSADVTFEESEVEEGTDTEDSAAMQPLGVLLALPEEARAHPSWLEPPCTEEAVQVHRRYLRRLAIASAKKLRASRQLGRPESVANDLAQEYAVLMTMIIVCRSPTTRLQRQRAFVERAEKRMKRAQDDVRRVPRQSYRQMSMAGMVCLCQSVNLLDGRVIGLPENIAASAMLGQCAPSTRLRPGGSAADVTDDGSASEFMWYFEKTRGFAFVVYLSLAGVPVSL
ncbi:unnamed protein product [Prorocentrum cordatum]|uniref:Uncharacterized protein n=1 Tax=Prorocentrum cordatum TaxID=2364126 RepID=A0ABN9UZG7_9DINO|nr:unnamed protein product [Polarella glacialis]